MSKHDDIELIHELCEQKVSLFTLQSFVLYHFKDSFDEIMKSDSPIDTFYESDHLLWSRLAQFLNDVILKKGDIKV